MMKYVFLLAFIGAVIYASVQEEEPEFEFVSASVVERTEYLNRQKGVVKSQLNSALRSRWGILRDFRVDEVIVNRGGYTASLLFKEQLGSKMDRGFQSELLEAFCRNYLKTKTAEHKISIAVLLNDENRRPQGQIILSSSSCRPYLSA